MVATFHDTGIPGVRISDPQRRSGAQPFEEVLARRSLQETRRNQPGYDAKLLEAYRFFKGVVAGRTPTWRFEEAMTVSDFPILFGDILSRELLGGYAGMPVSWPAYVRKRTLPDATRQARRLAYDGIDSHMTSVNVRPDGTSPIENSNLAETGYLVGPLAVYERAVAINWKTLLADDLGAFNDIPGKLALAARRTEDFIVAGLLCDSSGPHASFFTAGNANTLLTANGAASAQPALSVQGLTDARNVMARFVNPTTGEPIVVDGATLVIPRELDVLAQYVFNAITIESNSAGMGGSLTGLSNSSGIEQRMIMNNWITNGLKIAVNPYLSTINTTNGTTAWYIVADPNKNRPAFELDFLAGEEAPILLRETPTAMRVGGGSADLFGSFDTGEIRFKVMHLLDGSQLDPKGAVSSEGDGS